MTAMSNHRGTGVSPLKAHGQDGHATCGTGAGP